MSTVPGITRAWRASVLATLVAGTHRAAFYTSSASLNKSAASLVYTPTGECSGTNYTPGGFAVSLILNNLQDPPFIDIDDLSVTGISVTDWRYTALYEVTAGNRIWMVIDMGTARTLNNRNVTIRWPLPTINSALMRALG